ncbi:hypothetical protein VDG1235_4872 [Verrucomicrobiia bacterium DG1235]|nr:hypothetical protein VDG1235_4872 [Verrucomicrobiae bacterium DG1235]
MGSLFQMKVLRFDLFLLNLINPLTPMKDRFPRAAMVLAAILFLFAFRFLEAEPWRDIDPSEFALTESEIDPGFGAEILFSETKYRQSASNSYGLSESIDHYMRFRVYNELGVSQLADWKLVYDSDAGNIINIKGRTVKPAGGIYELSNVHVFDTELVRDGQTEISAKSFAFPNVEPGDIVELQYSIKNNEVDWMPVLRFQERLPARRIFKRIKPFEYPGFGSKISRFNFPEADLSSTERGYYVFEKLNIGAFVDEPYSFPDNSLIPSIILYYFDSRSTSNTKPEKYWSELAKEMYKEGKKSFKPNKDIQDLAGELTKGLSSDWNKLIALYNYCENELVNLRYSRGVITEKAREKIKEKGKPQDTLSRGNGWPDEVTGLFGALAKAAGFEPRWAAMHNGRFVRFQAWMVLDFVMRLRYVAIDIDGETRYFRPGNPFLPCGDVEWFAADGVVLQAAPKDGQLELATLPDAGYSVQDRSLVGTIDEMGALKGKVSIIYKGYTGLDMKERLSMMEGLEEREEFFTDKLKKLMPQARFDDFTMKNRGSHILPLIITYDVEIPDYADVTSKRLYFQPFVFGKGAQDVFISEKRNSPLLFNYPSTTNDIITIQLPDGFELEEGSAPRPFEMPGFGEYKTTLKASRSGKVIYERSFRQDLHSLPVKSYPVVKSIFYQLNIRDQHALGFKRVEAE